MRLIMCRRALTHRTSPNQSEWGSKPPQATSLPPGWTRQLGYANRTAATILALIWLLLSPTQAMAAVTALTAGNTPQNVVLGQAMTATTITPTGTPYVPQWLGQSYTYEGPANSGNLAPDYAYSFTGPQDIVQLPNGNYYVLDSGNVRAIDRSTGQVTTLTLPALPGGLGQGASWGFGSSLGLDGNGNLYLQVDLNTILQVINVTTTPQLGATITQSIGLRYFDVSQSGDVYSTQYASLNNSGGIGSIWKAQVGSATTGTIASSLLLSESNMQDYHCGLGGRVVHFSTVAFPPGSW